MKLAEISHHAYLLDCYSLDETNQKISIQTGKDIKKVIVYVGDPFSAGIATGENTWTGEKIEMKLEKQLLYHNRWSVIVQPKYKRLKYHFELWTETEHQYLLEDGFYNSLEDIDNDWMLQRFIFPWMNPSDICKTPAWVEDTIWYQIFPDRFCNGGNHKKRYVNQQWISQTDPTWNEYYGGDLKGIIDRLPYLQDLGITGIYLTPIFLSDSNHKYNTIDYTRIDPDFGTEEELIYLIKEAHTRGIKIMIDAVMNHSASNFEPWLDVLKYGEKSKYANWFFVNKWPIDMKDYHTYHGDFYSFAFEAYMPKINTNNPEVMEYFGKICKHWVTDWNIDGIRFDVGNEIGHSFIKYLRGILKPLNQELYLLGEIWHDSMVWLQGDEYDSVMNYPFVATVNNFWQDTKQRAMDFRYNIDKGYSMYYEQVNRVIFNFLDSHDVDRVMDKSQGNLDIFIQKFIVLMTLEGSPCIYYGTEIGMTGSITRGNRKCMPWEEIEQGKYEFIQNKIKSLIQIRKEYSQCKTKEIKWIQEDLERVIHYKKTNEKGTIHILINADSSEFQISNKRNVIFENKRQERTLQSGGSLIWLE